jgi:protein tyrosine/serine phosphatase
MHLKRWWAAVLLTAAGGCASAVAPPSGGATPDLPPRQSAQALAGIDHFDRVDDSLYRGAQPEDDELAALARSGIRTVVCLRVFHSNRRRAEALGLNYHHISMKMYHPEYEDVLEFLRIVNDPNNRPVFVHCREGVDRTGLMVAAYRMAVQGWTKKRATREMKAKGFRSVDLIFEQFLEDMDVGRLRRELSEQSADGDGGPPAERADDQST